MKEIIFGSLSQDLVGQKEDKEIRSTRAMQMFNHLKVAASDVQFIVRMLKKAILASIRNFNLLLYSIYFND